MMVIVSSGQQGAPQIVLKNQQISFFFTHFEQKWPLPLWSSTRHFFWSKGGLIFMHLTVNSDVDVEIMKKLEGLILDISRPQRGSRAIIIVLVKYVKTI